MIQITNLNCNKSSGPRTRSIVGLNILILINVYIATLSLVNSGVPVPAHSIYEMHQLFVLPDVTNAGSRRETGSYRKIYLMIIAHLSVREREEQLSTE